MSLFASHRRPVPRQRLRLCLVTSWLLLASGAALHAGPDSDRLLNLSSSGWVGEGSEVFVAGFVIGPGDAKAVVIRAVGPTLAEFGVSGALTDPTLRLYNADREVIATNLDWNAADAEAFRTVGAFALPAGSRDAAIVTTLAPGLYSAQSSGPGGLGNGTGLIEIYDLSGPARLLNLSTRGRVEADRTLVISGFVVAPGAPTRRLLIRAVGPTLRDFGVNDALPDPSIALVRLADGVQLTTNNDWGASSDAATLSALAQAVGAFPLPAGSLDAAALVELPPGAYSMLVSGVGNEAGVALVEVYELTQLAIPAVSIRASIATADTNPGSPPGEFTLARTGDLSAALTVALTLGGTGREGVDYVYLPHTVTFPAGSAEISIPVIPYANTNSTTFKHTVEVSLAGSDAYVPGTSPAATITLLYNPGTLYVANLRPATGAVSLAHGTASIQLASDQASALINLAFAGLSSPQTVAYLRYGTPGDNGAYLVRLPLGQATNVPWDFEPTGIYSSVDLVQALREGRIYVSIESANFPGGELAGSFILNRGAQTFTAPPPPPDFSLAVDSDVAAVRFLTQATFGATPASVAQLRALGIPAWIDAQLAAPSSRLQADTVAEFNAVPAGAVGPNNDRPGTAHRNSAWWKEVLGGEDQLRQRVAFALSEHFVISIENATLGNWQEGVAHFHDLLLTHALGNFRDLLESVTLNPIMGVYLSHLRNAKADPATGSRPDENYAREIMQLFTIGLNELQPDGTLKLDERGLPVPTYTNATIQEMAKVFTGWTFAGANPSIDAQFRRSPANYLDPMVLFPQFHELGAKTLFNGLVLPAGQGGAADLRDTLDALFNHPNTGPFVSRRLIQRLVTSNPTPAYVYRVARVFADNGHGVRGDLAAVVRAILTDYEARSAAIADAPGFGKLKEPLLRLSALFRLLPISAADGRLDTPNLDAGLAQEFQRAPSVFNFFEPDFVRPGPLALSGLYAPEFQILNDTTAITSANLLYSYLYGSPSGITMDFTPLLDVASQPDALIERLNLYLAGHRFSPTSLTRLRAAYDALPTTASDLERVRSLTYLVLLAPEAVIQR